MNSLIVLIAVLVGYWLGNRNNTEEFMVNGVRQLRTKVTKMVTPTIPTGQIKPKTAEDIYQKNRPIKERESLQAMKETLDASPELAEHRRLVEKLKKNEL